MCTKQYFNGKHMNMPFYLSVTCLFPLLSSVRQCDHVIVPFSSQTTQRPKVGQ